MVSRTAHLVPWSIGDAAGQPPRRGRCPVLPTLPAGRSYHGRVSPIAVMLRRLVASKIAPGPLVEFVRALRRRRVTVLLLAVPEVEPAVHQLRMRFDPSAREGIPAHVTLIYPFLPRRRIGQHEVARLASLFARASAFDYQLVGVAGFPGVIYLTPCPPDPFVSLVEQLVAAFPDAPPYGGVFVQIVPHVAIVNRTVAGGGGEVAVDAGPICDQLATLLPVRCRAAEVLLLQAGWRGWRVARRFPLGGAGS